MGDIGQQEISSSSFQYSPAYLSYGDAHVKPEERVLQTAEQRPAFYAASGSFASTVPIQNSPHGAPYQPPAASLPPARSVGPQQAEAYPPPLGRVARGTGPMSLSSLVPRPTCIAPAPGSPGYANWLLRLEEDEALQTAIALSLEHEASFFPAPDVTTDESAFPSLQASTPVARGSNVRHFPKSK